MADEGMERRTRELEEEVADLRATQQRILTALTAIGGAALAVQRSDLQTGR